MTAYERIMSKKTVKRWLAALPPWALTVTGLLAILWLTLAPEPLGDEELPLFPGADKIAHMIMFGGFSLLLLLDNTRRNGWRREPAQKVWGAGGVSALLGVAVEIAQWKMEMGRSFEWGDIAADSLGALLCVICWFAFAPKIFYDKPTPHK